MIQSKEVLRTDFVRPWRQILWLFIPLSMLLGVGFKTCSLTAQKVSLTFDVSVNAEARASMNRFIDEHQKMHTGSFEPDALENIFSIRFPRYKISYIKHPLFGTGHKIQVAPCVPSAVLMTDSLYLFDLDRGPFQRIRGDKIENLPIITGIKLEDVSQKAHLKQDIVAIIKECKLTDGCYDQLMQIHRDESRSYRVSFSNDQVHALYLKTPAWRTVFNNL